MAARWQQAWTILKESVIGFLHDNALSHGAAIAFYAATSLAPILLIVVSVAGVVFGDEAAHLALAAQLTGLMGPQTADLLEATLKSASQPSDSIWATLIGIGALLLSASGVFGEMQASLNTIWKVEPSGSSISRIIRARAVSLGLVAALGFLLVVSLVASAAISALGDIINRWLPFGEVVLSVVNTLISFLLITVLFAAIYKVLPDRTLQWRDVLTGSLVTAVLFTVGKSLIGWYIGSSATSSSYGAAGALLVVLLWVYYSAEIFLFGAEITRAYSIRHGSRPDLAAIAQPVASPSESPGRSRSGEMGWIAVVAVAWLTAEAGNLLMDAWGDRKAKQNTEGRWYRSVAARLSRQRDD